MRDRRPTSVIAALATFIIACAPSNTGSGQAPAPSSDAAVVRRIADEFVNQANATGTQAWGMPSTEQRVAAQKQQDNWAAALARVNGDALYGNGSAPSLEWRLYGTLREAIEASRALRVCELQLWNVDQLFGWQAQAEYNAAVFPVA